MKKNMPKKDPTNKKWEDNKFNQILSQKNDQQNNQLYDKLNDQQNQKQCKNKNQIKQIHSKQQDYFIQQKRDKKHQQSNKFQINTQLISQLNQNIYKNIILKEFLVNNQAHQSIQDINQIILRKINKNNIKQNSKRKLIRIQQKQNLIDFIESTSLSKTFLNIYRKNQQQKQSFCNINYPSSFNNLLLDPIGIKFLYVFGPTGTGKTYTIKSIIRNFKNRKMFIWKNGMSIIESKVKRLSKNLCVKFYNIIWQKSKQFGNKLSKQDRQRLIRLSFKHQKILVIDEFDQIQNLNLEDILRLSYISEYQKDPNQQLFMISKIILISNQYLSLSEKFRIKQQSSNLLYVQKLIFQPYIDKEIQSIIQEKIQNINVNFLQILHQNNNSYIFDMFQQKIQGIFNKNNLKFIINKICYPQQKDIRKVLSYYCQSYKNWLESLNSFINYNQYEQSNKLYPKFQKYMISQDYLISDLTYKNNKSSIQDINSLITDDNPILFYLFNLQQEGKVILKTIYQKILQKKRIKQYQKQFQKHQSKQIKKILKQQICIQSYSTCNQSYSMFSNHKKYANTIFLIEFYKNISSKIHKEKIYQWLSEWQNIGLILIYETSHPFLYKKTFGSYNSDDIKITDNFLIQLLQEQPIRNLFYK